MHNFFEVDEGPAGWNPIGVSRFHNGPLLFVGFRDPRPTQFNVFIFARPFWSRLVMNHTARVTTMEAGRMIVKEQEARA